LQKKEKKIIIGDKLKKINKMDKKANLIGIISNKYKKFKDSKEIS